MGQHGIPHRFISSSACGKRLTSSLAEHEKDHPHPVRGGHAVPLRDAMGQHGAGGGCVGGVGRGLLGPAGQQGAQAELLVGGQAGQEAGVHHLLREALRQASGGLEAGLDTWVQGSGFRILGRDWGEHVLCLVMVLLLLLLLTTTTTTTMTTTMMKTMTVMMTIMLSLEVDSRGLGDCRGGCCAAHPMLLQMGVGSEPGGSLRYEFGMTSA